MKNNEYNSIGKLSVVGLALATSSVSYSSINYSSRKIETSYSMPKDFVSVSYKTTSIDYKQNINETIDISLEEAIKIAKENTPYDFKDIKIESISDSLGELTTIDIYMSLPNEVNDDLIIKQSKKATDLIGLNDYLVTYL